MKSWKKSCFLHRSCHSTRDKRISRIDENICCQRQNERDISRKSSEWYQQRDWSDQYSSKDLLFFTNIFNELITLVNMLFLTNIFHEFFEIIQHLDATACHCD
jgi:hypothetical protein